MLLERGIQIMSKTHHSIQGDTAQEHRWLAASTAGRLDEHEICRSQQGRQPHKTWYDRALLSTCQNDWQGTDCTCQTILQSPQRRSGLTDTRQYRLKMVVSEGSIMGKLDNKVALISGGARGQGAAEAKTFVKEGARVVFGDVRDEAGKQVEAEIRASGGEAVYVHLDVTSDEDWRHAVAEAVRRYGKLDILINNAGIVIPRVPIEARTAEEWDRVMAVNAKGVFLGTKYAIPAMRRAGGGSIVNISSIAGIGQSLHQEPAYAASKGAVRIFTKVTASQHAQDKIRCNSVHPGPVDTDMLHNAMPDPEILQRRLTRVPLGRMGLVEEIVAGVLFLASDDASYVTGSELVIDGGALAQ